MTSDVVANATATRTNENLNMIGNLHGLYLMDCVDKRNQVLTMDPYSYKGMNVAAFSKRSPLSGPLTTRYQYLVETHV